MSKPDAMTSFLSAVAGSAMAPFEAGIELATSGKIDTDTGVKVVLGTIGDSITR
ncbi:hypothetical protein [Erythrobacter sp. CCH5-A1]|uniref:hypothetical protein n=1 Tax=Erythrobacter sp. CCH5-A1 TaxID=1768792 RepID=UPI000AE21E10|nr:hypothetical protein [Erythrobacter sp. CCH5-A1]